MRARAENVFLLVTETRALQLLNLGRALLLIPAQGTTALACILVHPIYSSAQPRHKVAAGLQFHQSCEQQAVLQ